VKQATCIKMRGAPRTRSLLTRLLFVVFVAVASPHPSLHAQNLCSTARPVYPCLDQPQAGDTQITGRAKRGPVDIIVNDTKSYRNIKVIEHKFAVKGIAALGAGNLVKVIDEKSAAVSIVVSGFGTCENNTVEPCLNSLTEGQTAVAGKHAATNFKVLVNPANPAHTSVSVLVNADGDFSVPVPKLSQYDQVELHDAVGKLVVGPLMVRAKPASQCTAKSKLPCLSPVKETDKAIKGFGSPGSTIQITLETADKGQTHPAADGSFSFDLTSLSKGQKIIATQTAPLPAAGVLPATVTVMATPPANSNIALYTLGLVGINVAGSTDSGPSQQYFVSFDTRLPLPFLGRGACASPDEDYVMDYKCWVWFNPRIASAPTPSSSALKTFSSPSSLTSGINGETLGQITQTIEIQSGMEYTLFHGPRVPTSSTEAFRGALSLILGGGVVTPINSTSSASIFTLNDNLGNQFTENSLFTNNPAKSFANTYPALAGALCGHFGFTSTPACTPSAVTFGNVAFVLPNRSRFYRDYFAGIRLRTFFFTGDCSHKSIAAGDDAKTSCKAANVHPGTFDIRFGQDETVTAGFRRGVVMTIAASYPLPKTGGTVRIFGSMYMRLHHNENTAALALVAASSTIPITDPSVVIQPINPSDHDYYRLGIGADLIPIISKWMGSKNSPNDSKTATPSQ